MASRYEVEVKVTSATDLKNINWRKGPIKPYVVLWVESDRKVSSRVDEEGDTCPQWDQTIVVPMDRPIDEATLRIDVVHAYAEDDIKPLIGSAKVALTEVVDDVGLGARSSRQLQLKRPSGRPQGKLNVEITVRSPRYGGYEQYPAPKYGVSRDTSSYSAPPPSGYGAPQYGAPSGYGAPQYGAPSGYGGAPYGQPAYRQTTYGGQPGYGQPGYDQSSMGAQQMTSEEKKSKFGMGTGLAVGAVGGALGVLAVQQGLEAFEDNVAEKAAEKVEEDESEDEAAYEDDDGGW